MKVTIAARICVMGAIVASMVMCGNVVAGDKLPVSNDTKADVKFWIKSEHRGKGGWVSLSIESGNTKSVELVSPDRFQMVVRQSDGAEFRSGPVSIRALINDKPDTVLKLSEMAAAPVGDEGGRLLGFRFESPGGSVKLITAKEK